MLFLFLVAKLPHAATGRVYYILKRVYTCCTAYFYLCFLIFPLYLCDMILRKHSYFRYICILIYSCLMPVLLHSQNVVKQISNADGLSNNSVNCFLEDSEHTLWVGTWAVSYTHLDVYKRQVGTFSSTRIRVMLAAPRPCTARSKIFSTIQRVSGSIRR